MSRLSFYSRVKLSRRGHPSELIAFHSLCVIKRLAAHKCLAPILT